MDVFIRKSPSLTFVFTLTLLIKSKIVYLETPELYFYTRFLSTKLSGQVNETISFKKKGIYI